MTEFAPERPVMRSRGPSLPKLNLLPASHYLQQQLHQHLQSQSQHPFDNVKAGEADFDLDMDMDFDTTQLPEPQKDAAGVSRPFVSAHPSPDVSDEDSERGLGQGSSGPVAQHAAVESASSAIAVPPSTKHDRDQSERRLSREHPLSFDLFLAPVPIPSSRTPPHSPLHRRKNSSFSMNTPPGSATS
ncbi:hypothetical protein BGZ98_005595, partial [Dissophora globulifera]